VNHSKWDTYSHTHGGFLFGLMSNEVWRQLH